MIRRSPLTWEYLRALVCATTILVSSGVAMAAAPPVHGVTGSGTAVEEGVEFRTTVAAHQDADGHVWGVVIVNLDLRAFGVPQLITFRTDVTCLEVDGNSAWIGSVVTHSTNEDIIPVGTTIITLVRDLGKTGEDIMHGEPFEPSVLCSDRPVLPETIVQHGNYKVW